MKAVLATITGYKKIAILADNSRVEVGRVERQEDELSSDKIPLDWDSIKKKYPTMKSLASIPLYDTPSGDLEPGCLYWAKCYPENMFWDNHTGPHLVAVLPNGEHWIIDSRASNCGLPDDRLHRCWCRHGEPPDITVDKIGLTCNAGAGSIGMGDYHGFLRSGEFT